MSVPSSFAQWMATACEIPAAIAAEYDRLLEAEGFNSVGGVRLMEEDDWPSAIKRGHRKRITHEASPVSLTSEVRHACSGARDAGVDGAVGGQHIAMLQPA